MTEPAKDQGMRRRSLFVALAAPALVPALVPAARAQAFPSKPIRVIVAFAPGGATDMIGRLLAERLSPRLGVPVLVENRSGANGNIASEFVARAEPDGHVLLLTTAGALTVNPSFYPNLPFDVARDFAPVIRAYDSGNVLVVHPSLPVTNLRELAEYARRRPGQVSYASGGSGSSSHIFAELLRQTAGIELNQVVYRSNGPALLDVIAGNVNMLFDNIPASAPHIRAGRVRGLCVTSPQRVSAIPDVPTAAEAGMPEVTGTFWAGFVAPARTPAAAVARLNTEIAAILREPALAERLREMGAEPTPNTPAEMAALMVADTERWGRVVRAGNFRPD